MSQQYEYKVVTAPRPAFEYRVVPAPSKGVKRAQLKTPAERFSYAIQDSLNTLAAEGWEYVRAELLPSEERQGLASTHTVYRSVLIFRRLVSVTQDSTETTDDMMTMGTPPAGMGPSGATPNATPSAMTSDIPPRNPHMPNTATSATAAPKTTPPETATHETRAPETRTDATSVDATARSPAPNSSANDSSADDVTYKPKSEAAKAPLSANPKSTTQSGHDAPPVFLRANRDKR